MPRSNESHSSDLKVPIDNSQPEDALHNKRTKNVASSKSCEERNQSVHKGQKRKRGQKFVREQKVKRQVGSSMLCH